jgi:TATA-binding protein-associated factor
MSLSLPLNLLQVIAPVRETVSQTLASLLLHMSRRSVLHVHSILLQMIQQDFAIPNFSSKGAMDVDRGHVWEVRHAGLLGIKYLVAVRSDLFEESFVKSEGTESESGKGVLKGVADAAILGCDISFLCKFFHLIYLLVFCRLGDHDDDVRSVAASCLLPVALHLVEQLPESLEQILTVLWGCLSGMKDDLSSSVGAVMELLGKFLPFNSEPSR